MFKKYILIAVIFLQVFNNINAQGWGSALIGEIHNNSLILYNEGFQLPGVAGEILSVERNLTFDLPIQAIGYAWVDSQIEIVDGGMYKNFIVFRTQSNRVGGIINTRMTLYHNYYNSAIQTSVSMIVLAVSVFVSLYNRN